MKAIAAGIRGAHAFSVLAMACCRRGLFSADGLSVGAPVKVRFGRMPKPTRHRRALPRVRGFTVIELLVVMTVIIVLAGLILGTSGYVQKKGARSRAEAEIAAMSAALESYKADNGIYPRDATATDTLDPTVTDSSTYAVAGLTLYKALSGDPIATRQSTGKSYFSFKPSQLNPPPPSTAAVTSIRDPFGNPYGYSTAKAAAPGGAVGYNPTFDLWSTANEANATQWIKNW